MATFSFIQKSQLEGAKRLDAEYYQPEYLDLERKLNKLHTKTIDEISKSVVSFGAYSLTSHIEWQDSGVPYINVGDIRHGYVDFSNVKHISEKVDEILKKSRVTDGQILLTMAGTIGSAAVAHKFLKRVNANQAIAKITPLDTISPYYLAAFLNSKYGLLQTQREIVSSVQANIFLGPIKKFKVPIFDPETTSEIEGKYKSFLEELEGSKYLYSQAENLLLGVLGLTDFEKDDGLSWTTDFSDVKDADRIDVEYFQPKYEKLVSRLKNQSAKPLGDLVSMKKGIETGSEAYQDEGKLFIRVSSLSRSGIGDGNQKYLGDELYQKLRQGFEPKVGEILLTKDATPGVAYHVQEPFAGIISSGILRLKLKEEIEPEYLALCINSVIGQAQVERDAGGSIISHWRPEQIKDLQIPILPKTIQEKIANLVRQSNKARTRSKLLLEDAKRKVEEVIEKEGRS